MFGGSEGCSEGGPKGRAMGTKGKIGNNQTEQRLVGDGVSKAQSPTNLCSVGLFSVVGRLGTHRGWVTTLVI